MAETFLAKVTAVVGGGGDLATRAQQLAAVVEEMRGQADAGAWREVLALLTSEADVDAALLKPLVPQISECLLGIAPPAHEELTLALLAQLAARSNASLEPEAATARERFADFLAGCGEHKKAAEQMALVDVDSSTRHIGDEERLRVWLKAAQFFITAGQHGEADRYTSRAGQRLASDASPCLQTKYRECFATCQDYKRKYIEAARNYYNLACDEAFSSLSSDERQEYLRRACVCAVLESAGEQRARMLATLYKDERCSKLPVFRIVEDMYMERVVAKKDLAQLDVHLQAHHRVTLADGATVLEQAVMLHNLRSSSRVYNNISFEELGSLLGVSADKAEAAAAKLIGEGGMQGYIDQVQSAVHFAHDDNPIRQWDTQVMAACSAVNDTLDLIAAKYPKEFGRLAAGHL